VLALKAAIPGSLQTWVPTTSIVLGTNRLLSENWPLPFRLLGLSSPIFNRVVKIAPNFYYQLPLSTSKVAEIRLGNISSARDLAQVPEM
jgi:hypothetical protein